MNHSLYGGKILLNFDEKKHKYTIDKKVIPSVTGILKIMNKPALVPWAAKMVAEKILEIMPRGEVQDCGLFAGPVEWGTFEQLVLEAKNAPRNIKDDAGDVGKQAHKIIENGIQNAIREYLEGTTDRAFCKDACNGPDPRVVNCANAAFRWMEKHNVTWQKTETVVYSRLHNFSGIMDGLALVSSCEDTSCCPFLFKDVLSVIDWKSSNRLYPEYLLQTAAYQFAYEEEFEAGIADRWILRLGKEDGEFEAWHAKPEDFGADFAAFESCLHLTNDFKIVEKRVAAVAKSKPKKETDWLEE